MSDDELRRRYFSNLSHIIADPKKCMRITTSVFRNRIATMEFASTVGGMMVGSAIGFRVGLHFGLQGAGLGAAIFGGVGAAVSSNAWRNVSSHYKEFNLDLKRHQLRNLLRSNYDSEAIRSYCEQRNEVMERLFNLYTEQLQIMMKAQQQQAEYRQASFHDVRSCHMQSPWEDADGASARKDVCKNKIRKVLEKDLEMYTSLIKERLERSDDPSLLIKFTAGLLVYKPFE